MSYKTRLIIIRWCTVLIVGLACAIPFLPLVAVIGLSIPATVSVTSANFYGLLFEMTGSLVVAVFCGFFAAYIVMDYGKTKARWIQQGKLIVEES